MISAAGGIKGATIVIVPPQSHLHSMHSIKAGDFRLGLYGWEASRQSDNDPMEKWNPLVWDTTCSDTLAHQATSIELEQWRIWKKKGR